MKIADIAGYRIHIPTSGGKAGKGYNATSTIQVFGDDTLKQFRFVVADPESRHKAMEKAKAYILEHPLKRKSP